MEASQCDIFQGVVYYYRENRVICRYAITMRDAIDPVALQAALDEARVCAPYFFQKVVWERCGAHFEPNDAPCLVTEGSAQPLIPEETNDYQLLLHYEGKTIYLDWFHFLADGRGCAPFMTLIVMAYCNRRYGTAFACEPLASSPAYDVEKILAQFPESQVKNDMQGEVTETCESTPLRACVRIDRASLIDCAVRHGVKPVAALLALVGMTVQENLKKDELLYTFAVDTRQAVGAPNALYNCIASFQRGVSMPESASFADVAKSIDADLHTDLSDERKLFRMAEQMGWVYQVFSQKAPLRIQKRVFQMGEYISGFPSDYWVSYLGDPFAPRDPELESYVEDMEAWVIPDGASLGLEAVGVHGVLNLCIENKIPQPGFADALATTLQREGVKVLDVQQLPAL